MVKAAAVAVLVIIALGIGVYIGQTGIIAKLTQHSSGTGSSSSSTSQVSSSTAILATTLLNDYLNNAAAADQTYTGKTINVDGQVGAVGEGQDGNYQSCVNPSSIAASGCSWLSELDGFIIWNWQSQQAAANVPLNTPFAATCAVGGLQNGDLILNGCEVLG